jgi:exonuclease III
MVQLDLKRMFSTQRETQAQTETINIAGTGDGQASAEVIPPFVTSKSLREAKKSWTNVTACTYNCEHLSEDRAIQITREMEINNISIACIQGTRNKYGGDRIINGYKIFYESAGSTKLESYTGVAIIISINLLERSQLQKMSWVEGRVLAIRLKSKFFDHHFIAAYAPGDHLPRTLRNKFWSLLRKGLSGIPRRSTIILGIDANGHTGRDPGPGIGAAGSERWTENGLELQRTCTELNLTALNTLDSCANSKWTWQRRDGKGCTRIDYLVVSNRIVSQTSRNTGASETPKFGLQGATLDHRAVLATFNFKSIPEMGFKPNHMAKTINGFSNFNKKLTAAYQAYTTFIDNQYRTKQEPVNHEHLQLALSIQDDFAQEVNEYWNNSDC